eukprot:3351813-Prymnesium_polylepis.1
MPCLGQRSISPQSGQPHPVPWNGYRAGRGWFHGCAEGTECLRSLYKGHWWVGGGGGGCGRYMYRTIGNNARLRTRTRRYDPRCER